MDDALSPQSLPDGNGAPNRSSPDAHQHLAPTPGAMRLGNAMNHMGIDLPPEVAKDPQLPALLNKADEYYQKFQTDPNARHFDSVDQYVALHLGLDAKGPAAGWLRDNVAGTLQVRSAKGLEQIARNQQTYQHWAKYNTGVLGFLKHEAQIAGAEFAGAAQGVANVANGLQDVASGIVNTPANLHNAVARAMGSDSKWGTIESTDWSHNLIVRESDMAHKVSKFLGGQGLFTVATAGAGSLLQAGSATAKVTNVVNTGLSLAGGTSSALNAYSDFRDGKVGSGAANLVSAGLDITMAVIGMRGGHPGEGSAGEAPSHPEGVSAESTGGVKPTPKAEASPSPEGASQGQAARTAEASQPKPQNTAPETSKATVSSESTQGRAAEAAQTKTTEPQRAEQPNVAEATQTRSTQEAQATDTTPQKAAAETQAKSSPEPAQSQAKAPKESTPETSNAQDTAQRTEAQTSQEVVRTKANEGPAQHEPVQKPKGESQEVARQQAKAAERPTSIMGKDPLLESLSPKEIGAALRGEVTESHIISALKGTTEQANRIAKAIENKNIAVKILDEAAFKAAYKGSKSIEKVMAFARGAEIHLRKGSEGIYSSAVHEGTHALDYLKGLTKTLNTRQLEKRAYFFQRAFELATEQAPRFHSIGEMMRHIIRVTP